ncbi:MAG: hypothetical protein WCD42_08880, partial [Rhizomicrobium sp.]
MKRILPVLCVMLLAPMIAEYLLGDFSIRQLSALPAMILQYGAGAVVIREIWVRAGRHSYHFIALGLAFGLWTEGLLTQSLFNPDYLHLRLLTYGYLPALGTALPWALYVIGLHLIWSLAVPIGLTEAIFPTRRGTLWLGCPGLLLCGTLFLTGSATTAAYAWQHATIHATAQQMVAIVVLIILLCAGCLLCRPPAPSAQAPKAWQCGIIAFVLGSAYLAAYAFLPAITQWPVVVGAQLTIIAAAGWWLARPRHNAAMDYATTGAG